MRFSQTLQLNAVPDWIDNYVNYESLKKLIFQLEKERVDYLNAQHFGDPEKAVDLQTEGEAKFLSALDAQLDKVVEFYTEKESELYSTLDELETEVQGSGYYNGNIDYSDGKNHLSPLENLDSTFEHPNSIAPIDKNDYPKFDSHRRRGSRASRISRIGSRQSFESRLSIDQDEEGLLVERLSDLRSQLILLYISLSELESYVDLNRTAFEKILKKHDKVLEGNLKSQYINKMVMDSRPFSPETQNVLKSQLNRVETIFANTFCNGNRTLALRQMKTHLRDQVTFERNTVWKDMVRHERKTQDTKLVEPKVVKSYKIPFTNYRVAASSLRQIFCIALSIIVLIILLCVDCFGSRQENYCFALLIFSAIMWATEAIPLYATSCLIPFMIVPMGIMRNPDGSVMAAKAAAKATFSSMFSGTIMMLLGGFALAAALSKYGIAKAFASHVLSRAGTRPMWVLLAIMLVSGVLSMFISNVATPVLCFSLIDPILRTLPDKSRVGPCLILGIALSSCIGGMTSPISSPQNIVTLQYMDPNPGWGLWFAVALPVAIITVFVCWGLLLAVYKPARDTPHLNKIKPTKGKITLSQIFIVLVCIATIILWCVESNLEYALGDTGVIAAIPLFVFFGTGILGKEDLNNFLWSVVVLAQGGMALGNAVTSSGLLQDIAIRLKDGISHLPLIAILAIFCFLILVFATFVSHTVAALIIVPIVKEVGENLPIPHPNLLVMGAGLACSAGMGLPVSGFPNMSAIMLEDPAGKPYLSGKDFIITGIPTSVFNTILIFTLGYGIMAAIGY
ncbi:SPX domain-containing protein [Mycotypha africana]|uniref:SPX domain-containing protein n=1 Tax=Mycotypha africana TaxID=64632 RepID=UPI002301A849|nr:SPX domain-containing protein [Mycotypha africana]KAI8992021.1 SPX domain-containing protein [Mycotypha africana]